MEVKNCLSQDSQCNVTWNQNSCMQTWNNSVEISGNTASVFCNWTCFERVITKIKVIYRLLNFNDLNCRTFLLGFIWAPSSEFVSSSIPSWQSLTVHAQPFRRARDLAFCLKVPLDSLLVWASSEGSGETARMRRLAWTFAARMGDKYQIRLTRSI